MKLRNFMYATMIACAFASCSKDDVIDNGTDPVAKGDVNFTIQVDASNLAKTKAALPGDYAPENDQDLTLTNEDAIENITLVVFNSTGGYLAHATSSTADTKELSVAGLTPGTIQFIVLANMNINAAELTATNVLQQGIAIAADKAFNVTDGLPMSSALTNATLVSGDNYYGYTTDEITAKGGGTQLSANKLNLVRNVARVEIEDVKLDMAKSDYISGTATFQFTGVRIDSTANKATVGGVDATAGYVSYSKTDYSYFGDYSTTIDAVSQENFTTATTGVTVNPIKAYYYVLAKTQVGADNPTTLVVEGKFSLSGAKKKDNDQTFNIATTNGIYPVVVGVSGMSTPVNIENNKVYRITLLVAGPGYTDTGAQRANFFVNCKVADWTSVKQSAIIK